MFKNVASQKLRVYVFDSTTNLPKTGDAANLTAYRSLDYASSMTVLGDTGATEIDATNAKGWYLFDLTQAETNADEALYTCKSATANMVCLAYPSVVFMTPNRFTTQVIDAAGLVDANAVKVGPTGSGTAQTARDIGASVLLSSGTGTGQLKLASGYVAMTWADIAAPTTTVALTGTTVGTITTYTGNTVQTGDSFARIGAAGAGLTAVAWNAAWDAEVESEVNDALVVLNLDHWMKVAVTNSDVVDNSALAKLASKSATASWASFVNTTDSLEKTADQIALITPISNTPDSATVTTGSTISGTYADAATDDNTKFTLAPVTPAVGGFGLSAYLVFGAGTGRAPTSVNVNGYWNGTSSVNVWAYDYVAADWYQLTNSSTAMASRSSDTNYSYSLSREHMDTDGTVQIRFTATSTTTANRLYLDRVLVNSVSEEAGAATSVTPQTVWEYADRDLTALGVDVTVSAASITSIQSGLATPTNITAGTITTVTNLTNAPTNGDLTGAMKASINTEADAALSDVGVTGTVTGRIDAAVSSRMATYTQPTGFLSATFPAGTIANTTNITAGTITTVTTVTTCDTLTTYTGNTVQTGDSFARIGAAGVGLTSVALADATSDAIIADAVWNAATASYGSAGSYGLQVESSSLTAAQVNAEVDTALADVGLTTTITGRIDAAITTRLASSAVPTNFSVMSISGAGLVSFSPAATAFNGITPDAAFFTNSGVGSSTNINTTLKIVQSGEAGGQG